MSDFIPFLKVFPVLLLALMSPGSSFVMITNLTLARGRRAGIACAAGMGTGDFLYAALSLFGLGVIAIIPAVMTIVKIFGGLYLIYLGVTILRSTFYRNATSSIAAAAEERKERSAFMLGFMTGLTNPKVIIFYGSILTVAMNAHAATATKIFMAPFCGGVAFLWYGLVAIALSMPSIRAHYSAWGAVIDRVCGTVLAIFGTLLIVA